MIYIILHHHHACKKWLVRIAYLWECMKQNQSHFSDIRNRETKNQLQYNIYIKTELNPHECALRLKKTFQHKCTLATTSDAIDYRV